MKYLFLLSLFSTLSFAQLPQNKYKSDNGYEHRKRSKGIVLSVGYPVMSQFLNPAFVKSKQAGQMKKAAAGLSFYGEASIWYPFSIQAGVYNGEFQPSDDLALTTTYKSADLKVDHLLFEAFLCSKLLPNKSRFLPYIGIGYIDGGLELTRKDDTAKDKTVLSAIKIESAAWRVGMTIDVIRESGIGDVGLMVDYMQPFQMAGLSPNTFYAANRLQVGLFVRYN